MNNSNIDGSLQERLYDFFERMEEKERTIQAKKDEEQAVKQTQYKKLFPKKKFVPPFANQPKDTTNQPLDKTKQIVKHAQKK